jgi:hypothetical protein
MKKFTAKQQRDIDRINGYLELFDRALSNRDTDDPDWMKRTLLGVIDVALKSLAKALKPGGPVKWSSPFWAFQYPVLWDWEKWQWNKSELAMRYGELSSRNTQTRAKAMRSLAEIGARQYTYLTLQHFTNYVSTYKKGNWQHPMMPEDMSEEVRSLRGRKVQERALAQLFAPYSIGATEISLPEGLKSGQKIPKELARQLAEQTRGLRELVCPLDIGGHSVSVRIIFQLFPLIIDDKAQRAYFPITIGIALTPKEAIEWDYSRPPVWLDPTQWDEPGRRSLWKALSKFMHAAIESVAAPEKTEVSQEIEKASATMQIQLEATSPEAVQQSTNEILEALKQKGVLTGFQIQANNRPPTTPTDDLRLLLAAVDTAETAAAKGSALEILVSALLRNVPQFEVQKGVRTKTEEIDVKVLNSHSDPRWRDTPMILFECKNWSTVCGKDEVVLFERKLENRRGRAKLGFLVSWRGFAKTVPWELVRGSRGRTQVALLSRDHIVKAVEGGILPVLRDAVDRADAT